MMFESGQMFAHFKIIKKIGEGGMGEVYLAEDTKLNREVALKILLSEFLENPERRQRFDREARTAAQINNPHVMGIYDMDKAVNTKNGQELTYIVMEYIKGQSLTDYLVNRSPRMADLLRISEKIASGLAAAHKLKIIHRDIKTDNIIIDDQGEPKILDFGLAKPIDTVFSNDGDNDSTNTVSQELTQEGKILGTVSYMSPEQARGETVDHRSDIFSFGILVYKLMTGESPFEATDRVSILAKILEGKPVPIRQKNESVPAELERIIDKCLQKNPEDRYQDTRDLVVDLRSLRRQFDSGISETSTSVTGMSAVQTPTKKKKSGSNIVKIALIVAGTIITLVILGLISENFSEPKHSDITEDPEGFARDLNRTIQQSLKNSGININIGNLPGNLKKENALAILGFENKTGDAELDWLSAGLPEILLTDLTQSSSVPLISNSRVQDCLGGHKKNKDYNYTHEDWLEASRSLGATKVLSGSFFKMGDKIRIDARLESSSDGKIILAEKVIGDDPFQLVDSITQKLSQSLDIFQPDASTSEVAVITSSNPEAYRYYILGMQEFDKFEFESSIAKFEEAIALDSSFALPYLRIGMAYSLRGRGQQGMEYFRKAKELEAHLPVKEKSILDMYCDLWLNNDYSSAFTKIKTIVSNYPDDKEARSFYAILLWAITKDADAAYAQLDTVLMIDPRFPTALNWYMDIASENEQYDLSIKYATMMKEYFPNSSSGYMTLSQIYYNQSKLDSTITICKEIIEKFPDKTSPLFRLFNIYIIKRDFDKAEEYMHKVKDIASDDNYILARYYIMLANLDYWRGDFKKIKGHIKKSLDITMELKDSIQIANSYQSYISYFDFFKENDSVLYYADKYYDWASGFRGLGYPFILTRFAPERKDEAKEIIKRLVTDFRVKVPKEMWIIADAIEELFDACYTNDSSVIAEVYYKILSNLDLRSAADDIEAGPYLVQAGMYDEALEILEPKLSGPDEITGGRAYITVLYYTAYCYEMKGDREKAKEMYEYIMKYWGDADMKNHFIEDARKRLAALTS